MRGVQEAELGAVGVVDDQPAFAARLVSTCHAHAEIGIVENVPRCLQGAFWELEFPLACAPIAGSFVDAGPQLTRFGKADYRLLSAEGHERAVRMEHRQIAFEVVDEVELHFCQFRIVRGEVLDAVALWQIPFNSRDS